MSKTGKDPTKKHRHDIGAVDHGPVATDQTTRAIQVILGLCVASSAALTLYAVAHLVSGISAP